MVIEIKVPELGESISEVQIANWLVQEGDTVAKDQDLVSVDSEKATVEIPAPAAGRLAKILKPNGEPARVGDVIGQIEASGEATPETKAAKPEPAKAKEEKSPGKPVPPRAAVSQAEEKPKAGARPAREETKRPEPETEAKTPPKPEPPEMNERSLETGEAELTDHLLGKAGLASKEKQSEKIQAPTPKPSAEVQPPPGKTTGNREDEIKPMTLLRRTVAKRLVEAQHSMAILTTFNEVDMSAVIALRKQYQESFQAKYGVKVGFMSFFVKAVIESLKLVPQLNAEIRGDDIVFHRYFDIGVAIGAGKGLVVPPLRHAERMSFAEIEKAIADLATRARDNKLKPDELEGGTFTISNGGVYGSMLSTPIINPPQSGILGLHAIQERPVARGGQVVVRPMMFVALSYDHRIVDGREAVTFLGRVKEIIEDPARLMLEV
jgi:2-oxoglutarate dehydrogenase E2 component (dihydrolipoamide succinyltransferase)